MSLGGDRLWLAGVDDLWWGKPNLDRALDGVPSGAAVVLLSHNPDFAEDRPDGRVGLVLSGHTHGGQVIVPALGAVAGRKFPVLAGYAARDNTALFVSRGVGTVYVPIRVNCPPDVAILTLRSVDLLNS